MESSFVVDGILEDRLVKHDIELVKNTYIRDFEQELKILRRFLQRKKVLCLVVDCGVDLN